MNKIFLAVTVILGILAGSWIVYGAEIEIEGEIRPIVNKAKIDTVLIHPFSKTATIVIRKGYIDNGEFVSSGEERKFIFMDREDNPDTPESEFSDEFTTLMQTLNVDLPALRTLIKSRL